MHCILHQENHVLQAFFVDFLASGAYTLKKDSDPKEERFFKMPEQVENTALKRISKPRIVALVSVIVVCFILGIVIGSTCAHYPAERALYYYRISGIWG